MPTDSTPAVVDVPSKQIGEEYAARINDAVTRKDSKVYSEAMSDIKSFSMRGDKAAQPQFEEALLGNVDLKTASLYEAKVNFGKVDRNADGAIGREEVYKHGVKADNNPLQRALMKEMGSNFSKIANHSSDGFWSWTGAPDEKIVAADLDKGLQKAGAEKVEQANKLVSPESAVKPLSPAAQKVEYDNALEALTNPDVINLEKMAEDNEKKASVATVKESNTSREDVGERGVDALKDAPTKSVQPSEELMKLATVRRGEGPWHSAERILSAHGHKSTVDEVRSLAKAFKALEAEGGRKDLSALKVNHGFVSNENFGNLLTKVTNPKAKEALLRFVAK